MKEEFDYIVVGSGIAGLFTALQAQEHGSVLIITKGRIDDTNTRLAQGGIAAAVGRDDSPERHIQDTLEAGAGLCDPEMVAILAREGPQRILDLIGLGVPFDTLEGELALGREAAHSVSRVLHAGGDATGAHIETTLTEAVRRSPISLREHTLATELVVEGGRAVGLYALDERSGETLRFACRFLVLATGGAGQLFRHTTNPEVATGDGVVLAFRAGAQIMDMEFYQFHPTAFRIPEAPCFLVSEAVRGEGGILRDVQGRAFMKDYHPLADLAPRDVVSRAIVHEMRRASSNHVLLDVTHLPGERIRTRFPHIYRFALDHGLDITVEPMPVAPAAHYMMGGVKVNAGGMSTLEGLYACGEVACTAVHGANRLASNSLLESLVFAKRVVDHTQGKLSVKPSGQRREQLMVLPRRRAFEGRVPPFSLAALQELVWDNVGIVRDGEELVEAARVLSAWADSLPVARDRPSHELANLLITARLMTEAAIMREESRGAHFRSGFPLPSPEWERHIVLVKEEAQ